MSEIISALLVDQIYQKIKEDIFHKRLTPGGKINPRKISEQYNISVTPIKQALNRLVSEGLVECIPHRGMIVKRISRKDLLDSLEARKMIELYSVPSILKAAETDPGFLRKLRKNLKDHEDSIAEAREIDNYLNQNNRDFEFHRILVESTHNGCIYDLFESIGTHMTLFYLYGNKRNERFEESLKEHKDIFDSIERGDESALINAITAHIEKVQEDYCASIDAELD